MMWEGDDGFNWIASKPLWDAIVVNSVQWRDLAGHTYGLDTGDSAWENIYSRDEPIDYFGRGGTISFDSPTVVVPMPSSAKTGLALFVAMGLFYLARRRYCRA